MRDFNQGSLPGVHPQVTHTGQMARPPASHGEEAGSSPRLIGWEPHGTIMTQTLTSRRRLTFPNQHHTMHQTHMYDESSVLWTKYIVVRQVNSSVGSNWISDILNVDGVQLRSHTGSERCNLCHCALIRSSGGIRSLTNLAADLQQILAVRLTGRIGQFVHKRKDWKEMNGVPLKERSEMVCHSKSVLRWQRISASSAVRSQWVTWNERKRNEKEACLQTLYINYITN